MYGIKRNRLIVFSVMALLLFLSAQNGSAAKLLDVTPLDRDYLIVHIADGEVVHEDELNKIERVDRYNPEMAVRAAVDTASWIISSTDDPNYRGDGRTPSSCFRKKKLNGHAESNQWDSSAGAYGDWVYESTYEHWVYLELPEALQEGATYELTIGSAVNSDTAAISFTFDSYNTVSEAIHVNLTGYNPSSPHKAADLYYWMGDGGARNYSGFEGIPVYLYNVDNYTSLQAGTVQFWKSRGGDVYNFNLTGSDVWNIDFSSASTPGTYRLVIEGIGCSQDFEIAGNVYHDPFAVSVRGYYYMRMGEGNPNNLYPPPRTPLYIPGQDNTTVFLTTMHPYHPEWSSLADGDKWDKEEAWVPYVKTTTPNTNPNGWGGHSDAADEDRHLAHVVNIYAMLLPYIMSNGDLDDDDLGITESGNTIPDIIDEARWEVDFWLRLRDGEGYSHGLTNSNSNKEFFQAAPTPMAAWANAANAAMLADAFRLAGNTALMNHYRDAAIEAYTVASGYSDQMLDEAIGLDEGKLRGRDLKMTAAAYLYNVTGDTVWEDVVFTESSCAGSPSTIQSQNGLYQLFGVAGYLVTPQTVHYPDMYDNMKLQIINEAKSAEADLMNSRPSRRTTYDPPAYWRTAQVVNRTIVAHAVTDNPAEKNYFRKALTLEADWALGRNPMNIIEMTTAHTTLESKRSITESYTSGRYDGAPGVHPGHTPYMNLWPWGDYGVDMTMSLPVYLFENSYPIPVKESGREMNNWPTGETYFPSRWVYAHNEFTPRQTMKDKLALHGYLHSLSKLPAPADTTLSIQVERLSGGDGSVTATGISCGSDCWESYAAGSSVALIATPDSGSQFAGWRGGCYGDGITCEIDMDIDQMVTAAFEPAGHTYELAVTLEGNGTGAVSSVPAGITCGNDCGENFPSGSSVVLTPLAEAGSYFMGWGGACSGTGDCEITMSSAKSVTAKFRPDVAPELYIYDDALADGWASWSWNGTFDFAATSPVHSGTHSINATLTGWGGLSPATGGAGIDTYGYGALGFWIHGGEATKQLVFFTEGNDGESEHVVVTATANTWTEVVIPLEDLGDPGNITRLDWTNSSASNLSMFTVDDIRLVPAELTPVTGVSVDPASGTIAGGTLQLTAAVEPENASNTSVTWSSGNSSVASVNSSGLVIGHAVGTATITATTEAGGFQASAEVTVTSRTNGRIMKVMPLGDSITEGYTIGGAYRLKLWQNLEDSGLVCGVDLVGSLDHHSAIGLDDPDHEGHSGWTTGMILENIDTYMAAALPDIVMMHLGTNDIAQEVVDQAPANLRALIDHITTALPDDGRLYVAKIIPMGGVGNADSINYNNIIEAAVIEKQNEGLSVYLVDAYSIWPPGSVYYIDDWTHPNQLGYDALGDFWFDVIKDDVQLPCGVVSVDPGDVNGDGSVTLHDAVNALKVTVDSPTSATDEADVNEDGRIGIEEAIRILQDISSPGETCEEVVNPLESFDATDAPESVQIQSTGRYVSTPWGYNKGDNTGRLYPIVVNGCWGEGGYFTTEIRKKYPAFYLEYQQCDSDADGANLAGIIDAAVGQGLRIDENRIYLTGFSKGGSGSYKLVRGFLSENKIFAGLIRLAGQSESVLPDEAVAETSIWYHIGTSDVPERVTVAQQAYEFVKNHSYNSTAGETSEADTFTGFPRITKTLTKDGMEIMKYSVYDGMGHVTGPPYSDPAVFDWLFGQSRLCR